MTHLDPNAISSRFPAVTEAVLAAADDDDAHRQEQLTAQWYGGLGPAGAALPRLPFDREVVPPLSLASHDPSQPAVFAAIGGPAASRQWGAAVAAAVVVLSALALALLLVATGLLPTSAAKRYLAELNYLIACGSIGFALVQRVRARWSLRRSLRRRAGPWIFAPRRRGHRNSG